MAKKVLSVLMVVLLVLQLPVFAGDIQLVDTSNDVVAQPLIEETTVTDEKRHCTATIADSFKENVILITLTKEVSAENKLYTATDFSRLFDIDIVSIDPIFYIESDNTTALINWDEYRQIYKVEIPQSGKQAVLDAVKIIEQHPFVRAASPSYIIQLDTIESTTETVEQETTVLQENILSVQNQNTAMATTSYTNDLYVDAQYAIQKIGLPEAWELCTGSSQVLVGVLDSGIDGAHPDLADNIHPSLGGDFVDHDDSHLIDLTGHGTAVAGVIGAVGNNSKGITGVCWDVKLVSLQIGYDVEKYNPDTGEYYIGTETNNDYVIAAIDYAVDHQIPILNFSYGGDDYDGDLEDAIAQYAGLFVTAAGNEGNRNIDTKPLYPASLNLNNIIVATAVENYDILWEHSSVGNTSVDLAAPGESILGTYPASLCASEGANDYHVSPGYHYADGTSLSAPYVAGVAALLLSYYPDLTAAELKSYILNSVDPVAALTGKVATGGRLNAANALRLANDYHGTMYDRFVTGDFNGDGKDDTACFAVFNDGAHSEIRVSLSNGTSAQPWDIWFQSTAFDAAQTTNRMVAGDFDGDGDDDIAVMYDYGYEETGKSKIFVFKSTGSSFGSWPQTWFSTTAFPATKVADRFVAGDFNGDGKDDIAAMFDYSYYMEEGTSKIFVFVSTGSSFGSWPQTWYNTTSFDANKVTGRFVAGDFNEDGKDDIAAMFDKSAEESGKCTIYVFKSTGSSFGSAPLDWFTNGGFPANKTTNRFTAGDFDGDGDDDIAVMFDYSFQAAGNSKIFVFKSSGSSFGSWPKTWFNTTAFPANKVTYRFAAGDLTGDGKADIAALYNYIPASQLLSTEYVFKSTGSSFGSWPQTWIATPSVTAATANVLEDDEYYQLHSTMTEAER